MSNHYETLNAWGRSWCVLIMLLACMGCERTTDKSGSTDRSQLLSDYAQKIVVPTYAELKVSVRALHDSIKVLCNKPDAQTLEGAQAAWREARRPWKRAEAFQIGPVSDQRIDGDVDFWPIRMDDIEEILAATDELDAAFVAGLGATRKGLPVLEFLLFDDAGEQSVALGKLSDADGPSRRCRYAEAVAEDVVNSIDKLHEAWVSEEDGFAAALAASGQAGGAYSSQALALNDVVNKLIFAVETMESKKLSKPLGRQDDNPKPILVESRFSNNAVADLIDNYEGVRSVYFAEAGGDAGFGLDDAVRSLSPEIDQSIQEQLLLVKADLDSLPIPLDEAVVTNRQDVERAFQSTKQLLRLFGADMSGVLGTTPTFSDNDGD